MKEDILIFLCVDILIFLCVLIIGCLLFSLFFACCSLLRDGPWTYDDTMQFAMPLVIGISVVLSVVSFGVIPLIGFGYLAFKKIKHPDSKIWEEVE